MIARVVSIVSIVAGVWGGAGLFVNVAPAPATVSAPARGIGVSRCTFVDPSRKLLDYQRATPTLRSPDRTLATEVRYPTTSHVASGAEIPNAPVLEASSGYPMIVFAHGYDVTPDTYAALLDAWVNAGFVVIAPFFPGESPAEVTAEGGANTEEDLFNEPADLAFVTRSVLAASTKLDPRCPLPKGFIDPNRIGIAGHSDGATAVGAFSYAFGRDPQGRSLQALRASINVRATVVMSGEEDGIHSYANSTPGSSLLVIQSAADTCNPARYARVLYDAVGQTNKFFLELKSAHHLPPFSGADRAAFGVVVSTTVRFFRIALRGATLGRGFVAFGNQSPTIATMTSGASAPVMANAPNVTSYCGLN